ncbi:hypothetical protein [Teredinibacter sp. KSP-S5-2]|nr:hypothetical protein [Teredinibacter sp. KSP-S5-2]WNO09527.1 hypothetical protein P5V12_21550 [Teredinibacter sp. KSP-S5-2]
MDKYQGTELVDKLMQGVFLENQSADQILDSLSTPYDIDQKVL